jgi:hypothetical protein
MSETRVELHSRECSCRGGSWVLLEESSGSPCPGPENEAKEKEILSLKEWRQLGKPGSLESCREARERAEAGERREFQRYDVRLDVRLSRIATWRDPDAQSEDTVTEAVATGGALVQSRMAIEKGEIVHFAVGDQYESRAEVMYVSTGQGPGLDGVQRLGLKFLDAPLPESFIPKDATPLP